MTKLWRWVIYTGFEKATDIHKMSTSRLPYTCYYLELGSLEVLNEKRSGRQSLGTYMNSYFILKNGKLPIIGKGSMKPSWVGFINLII